MRTAIGMPTIFIDGISLANPFGNNLDLDPDEYEDDVQLTLNNIQNTGSRTARFLFNRLAHCGGRTLSIRPTLAAYDTVESEEETQAQATERDGRETPEATAAAMPKRLGGTGAGSFCVIPFIRQTWLAHNLLIARGLRFRFTYLNYTPEDLLFHELVHALRIMRGLAHPITPVGQGLGTPEDETNLAGFVRNKFEEWVAILITNIYASETGRPNALRDDHGFNFVPASVQNMREYHTLYQSSLARLWQEMGEFMERLATINTPFNPLRPRTDPFE
jgi:hypothetical protein